MRLTLVTVLFLAFGLACAQPNKDDEEDEAADDLDDADATEDKFPEGCSDGDDNDLDDRTDCRDSDCDDAPECSDDTDTLSEGVAEADIPLGARLRYAGGFFLGAVLLAGVRKKSKGGSTEDRA